MRAPENVERQDNMMDKEKRAALEIEGRAVQSILFDQAYSDEDANAIITDYNRRWLAAGGSVGSTFVTRG